MVVALGTMLSWTLSAQNCQLSYAKEVQTLVLNDSVTLAYRERGQGDQTLLLIHGLGGNLTHWSNNFTKNQRVIALDLPGYGLSSMRSYQPPTDLLDFYADVILHFINKKNLDNVVLLGHSMGGQIAMIAALKKPKSFKKLVLVAPAGLETFTEAEAQSLLSFAKPEIFKNQPEALVRAGFKRNFYAMPATVETLIQDRLLMARCPDFDPYFGVVAAGVRGMLVHPIRHKLGQMKVPTLVIFGENDDLIPNKLLHKSLTTIEVSQIAREIPNAQIQLIPQAGHLVMYEQATLFNQSVLNFIKQ